MTDKTFLIVDGTALAYRAFYAIAGLTRSDGKPTNALFGFVRMLEQLKEAWKPTHCIVVFDGGLPEERMKLLPEYKAQRKPMPDELREQFPIIEDFLEKAAIKTLRVDGAEADDVMATLARQGEESEADVLMATADKDMFQIVTDKTGMVLPTAIKVRMGPEEVNAKIGCLPERALDWQALTGDSVDNIPGVPGVGPKTAVKLLAEFGSVENLLLHLDDVSNEKLRQKLKDHEPIIRRNMTLMRLDRDMPDMPDLDSCVTIVPDADTLKQYFESYELDSLVNKIESGKSALVTEAQPKKPRRKKNEPNPNEMMLFDINDQ